MLRFVYTVVTNLYEVVAVRGCCRLVSLDKRCNKPCN
jgi:hypothetical protein